MAVLLIILKWIGVILLILLGLVVLVGVSVLFVPVCYFAECSADGRDSVHISFSVSWLFRLVRLRKGFSETDVHLYLFGIRIGNLGRRRGKKKPRTVDDTGESVRLENERAKVRVETDYEGFAESEEPTGGRQSTESERQTGGRQTKGSGEPSGSKRSAKSKKSTKNPFSFDAVSSIIAFIRGSENRSGLQKAKKELGGLFRYVLPQRVRGRIVLGTGDPCTTGWLFGLISMFPAAYTEGLSIAPDFEEKRLDADVNIRGRMRLLYFLRLFLRGYMDEDMKGVIQRAMQLM